MEQPSDTKLVHMLTILRGLLAKPSGNDDDPYERVVLQAQKTQKAGKVCEIKGIGPNLSDDDIRKQLTSMFGKCCGNDGCLSGSILVDGLGSYNIVKEETTFEYSLRNKIAIVTGAAGAIGAGICRGLLQRGCRVAATDLVKERLDELVSDLGRLAEDRIIGVQVDVTDKASVAAGFNQVTAVWGGVDIIVVNAGIALVASLMEMDPEAFRKLEKVNVEGALLTMAEAGRCLCRQGTGGDIVLVSSKNVFAPGAQFGAYSATKAASHQLARIASLEFAPFGVRVNMVSPDGVFSDGSRKSGLWAEVGPSRMKARGLDEKGLEEYYRNRNLLKSKITPAHVANAVLFFATRQTPTTGATIPVDGGVPEAAPR